MQRYSLNGSLPDIFVGEKALEELKAKKEALLNFVNKELSTHKELNRLIGDNPVILMYKNHENHINFMINVFGLRNFKLLSRILPWVYKTYSNKGFSFDYFIFELNAWLKAIKGYLSTKSAKEIIPIYEWMLSQHENLIELAKDYKILRTEVPQKWKEKQRQFLKYLLLGDCASCLKMATFRKASTERIQDFLLYVVQPSLYEVGEMWERGEITEANKHLATGIVGRVMANLYVRFPSPEKRKGRCLITTTCNEFHELGGRMVADFLELDGWDVTFLGANVPLGAFLKLAKKQKPRFIGISVTMPFNLESAAEFIKAIKGDKELRSTTIIAGGVAFNILGEQYMEIGADLWAKDAKGAVEIARTLVG